MPGYRKKLMEVALPLEAINREAAREKSIRHGHPSTLHLWWARRPLAACRAVLFGQLVDEPSAWPERFPTEEAQAAERDRLHKLIARMVPWEASNDEAILNEARWEIARSIAWNRGEEPPAKDDPAAVFDYLQTKAPPVYDPFCGGGSIPMEAQRLGLRAYGSDLNPVAVLISKALVEIPPKFAGLPPVNPESRAEIARGGRWQGRGAQGLAEDVRHYGSWMRDEAKKRIGRLYPQATLPDGSKATVIAWLWARTVASPNPAAKAAHVPLVSSFMLSTRENKKAWVEPIIDPNAPDGWRFEVQTGQLSKAEEEKARAGTKAARGANFICARTGSPISPEHIKAEGRAGRMKARLMAIVAEGARGRIYLSPDAEHERIAETARPAWEPEGALPINPRWFSPPDYGMPEYKDLFTPRQLVALTTFSDLVAEAREKALADARAAGLAAGPRLADGSPGAEAYADALATYLSLAVDKAADRNTALCVWETGMGRMRNTFGRQAIPMVWDFVETNPLAGAGGDIAGTAHSISEVLQNLEAPGSAEISQRDVTQKHRSPTLLLTATDPPYYDNVGYADLSDFFYVWLRRSLKDIWPKLFATVLVPKAQELVATPYRHGGREAAERFFMEGMKRALANMAAVSAPAFPLTLYYAFKQSEKSGDGIVSTGWATFLQAILDTGLAVDGTWPMRSELSNRMIASGTNALASSIVLACRKRDQDAPLTTRAAFLREMKRELPAAIRLLQAGNVVPVDLAQASIGPGMAIFSRYAKVLKSDDKPMEAREALQDINGALDAFLSEQEAEYDAYTRFAITWFEQSGMAAGPYGTAETLATARGISVGGVRDAGIVESGGGKVRLKRREEMDGTANGTVWGSTQQLIHQLMDGSEESAAEALAGLGYRAEAAKDLAYRLYGICERKKWAEEGYAYNALVASWPRLVERAKRLAPGPAQGSLAL
jgi:putative DNA methylase